MTPEHTETTKSLVDALSIGIMVTTIAQLLPAIAALFTIAWTAIRIIETDTVRGLLAKWRKPK